MGPPTDDPDERRKALIRSIEELPVLPAVALTMLQLDRNANSYFDKVLELVESEPRLAARVLAVANSVAGESHTEISSLRRAVARMGSTNVSNLVLGIAVTASFTSLEDWDQHFWRHSIQVATGASQLAAMLGDPEVRPEEAYACGLLHDIGRLLMVNHYPKELRNLDEGKLDAEHGLLWMEQQVLGLTHAELGGLACKSWGLPHLFEVVVHFHHSDNQHGIAGKAGKLIALLQATDTLLFPSAIPGADQMLIAKNDVVKEQVLDRLPPFLVLDVMTVRQLLQGVTAGARALVSALGH